MLVASVHVNNRPLDGDWDGQGWEQQGARCSNNFLGGPTPPVPPPGVNGLVWQVVGPANPDAIVFNISVDLQNGDPIWLHGVRNGQVTTYLYTPVPNGVGADKVTPLYNDVPLSEFFNRGIYIASVHGADTDFMLNVVSAGSVTGLSAVGALHVHAGTAPVSISIGGGTPPPGWVQGLVAEAAGSATDKTASSAPSSSAGAKQTRRGARRKPS